MQNVRCTVVRTPLDFDKTLDSDAHTDNVLIKIDDRERERRFRQIVSDIFQDRQLISRNDFSERMSYLDSIDEALEEMVHLDIELFYVMLPMKFKNTESGGRFEWDVSNYFFVPKLCFYASSSEITQDLVVHLIADNCVDGLRIWMRYIRYREPIAYWNLHAMFNQPTMPTFCTVCCHQLLEIRRNLEVNDLENQ